MAERGLDLWQPYRPPAGADAPALAEPGAAGQGDGGRGAADDEAALWRRWREQADAAAQALLVERHIPYARALAAKRYARRAHDEVEFDDYVQFAMVGLMEAIGRYAPERGAKFTTFATPRIHGAILDGLERLTERQQQLAFRRRLAAERAASLVPEDLSTDPTHRLLSQLEEIGVGVALGFLLEGTGMVAPPAGGLPDDAYAHAQLELRQLHDRLWGMMDRLTPREREIIELHYRESRRFEEIAEMLRLSRGRISQLHRQAVERLRTLMSTAETCDVSF